MLGIEPASQRQIRCPYAGWLIDGNLFGDRQMHRQMEKRIAVATFNAEVGAKSGIDISQDFAVLWMLLQPVAGDGFERRENGIGDDFLLNFTKESADIIL